MSDRTPARGARSGSDGPRKRPGTSAPQRRNAEQRGSTPERSAPQRGSSGTTKPSQPTRLPPQREGADAAVDVHACDSRSSWPQPASAAGGPART